MALNNRRTPFYFHCAQVGRGPTAVLLAQGSAGLAKESVALCHQVTTLDRAKLKECLGALDAADLIKVEVGLRAALALR